MDGYRQEAGAVIALRPLVFQTQNENAQGSYGMEE
jgi:hypothetical protein